MFFIYYKYINEFELVNRKNIVNNIHNNIK